VVQDNLDELGVTTPDHWSEGYLKNLIQESNIVEVAVQESSFLSVLVGMFTQPNQGINRGEALQFLLVLSGTDIGTVEVDTVRPAFTDVPVDYLRAGYIEFADAAGLVDGYADGSFGPDLIVNRAEALKMSLRFFDYEIDTSLRGTELLNTYDLTGNPFSDVDLEAWYAPYLIYMYSSGVVTGYGDGTFGPANPVTYAELLKIATLSQNIQNAVELASELE